MEALAAFGLAASILQVVDFGTRLVGNMGSIIEHGTTIKVADVERAALDLIKLKQHLAQSAMSVSKSNPDDADLNVLALESQKIARTLIEQLSRLRAHPQCGQFRAIRHAFLVICSKDEVDAWCDRMQKVRNDLQFRILVSIKTRLEEMPKTNDETISRRRKETESILTRILDEKNKHSEELASRLEELLEKHYGNTELAVSMHQETLEAIRAIPLSPTTGILPYAYVGERIRDEGQIKRVRKAILDRLRFSTMVDRYDEISVAHQETFSWIFKEEQRPSSVRWSNFRAWLSEGDGIYWVSGKAASGKSTLLKYIDRHESFRTILSAWAGNKTLIASSYFFWYNGTRMQRKLLGMLQALLCQVLEQDHSLIAVAFPEYDQQDLAFVKGLHPPRMPEVKAAMKRVLNNIGDHDIRICFLIDGLDEFEGSDEDLADLSTYLFSIAASPHVKIVASSRPLAVFEQAFESCAKLQLQELTSDDITAYVNFNLYRTERMVELRQRAPQEAAEIVSDIVAKASGVFLWVKLVVRSVLAGLRAFDDIEDLKQRVEELPPDLEELYRYMLKSVSPRYLAQASRLIQIVRQNASVNDKPLSTLLLSLAYDKDLERPLKATIGPLTMAEKFSRCREMDIKLRTRTSGLLEVQHKWHDLEDAASATPESKEYVYLAESHVQFLHKSVTDFLDNVEDVGTFLTAEDPAFNPNVSLVRAYLMKLKIMEAHELQAQTYWGDMRCLTTLARKAEQSEQRNENALLNEADRVMTLIVPRPPGSKVHWRELSPEYNAIRESEHGTRLSYYLQNSLFYYTQAALELEVSALSKKSGRPLLDYALCPWHRHETTVLLCNAELSELLISHGAKTTVLYQGEMLYQRSIRYLTTTEMVSLDQFLRSIRIFQSLFDGGMDSKATFETEQGLHRGGTQKRRYSVLRVIRMVFIERETSKSAEGLVPQAWMRKLDLDQDVKDAAAALEHRAVSLGVKDKEWRDNELVLSPSSNRLKTEYTRFKSVWKRKSA